eukprot:881236-Pelagomonas_calceolata.AAC.1
MFHQQPISQILGLLANPPCNPYVNQCKLLTLGWAKLCTDGITPSSFKLAGVERVWPGASAVLL